MYKDTKHSFLKSFNQKVGNFLFFCWRIVFLFFLRTHKFVKDQMIIIFILHEVK
jgi:hypothetical protein